jgi:hypothetical protein
VSRAAASALAAALLAAGCASKPPASPDAAACLAEVPSAKRTSDYAQRLASLKTRAAFFAGCMEARGYELNEAALQDELFRQEQVRNADPLGGDPQLALRLREQELRASPEYWRKVPGG